MRDSSRRKKERMGRDNGGEEYTEKVEEIANVRMEEATEEGEKRKGKRIKYYLGLKGLTMERERGDKKISERNKQEKRIKERNVSKISKEIPQTSRG